MIKDSGERREFESGAVRDRAEGKGRCDLLPLEVVAQVLNETNVIPHLAAFQRTHEVCHLYDALDNFIAVAYPDEETAVLEVSKHFEEGSRKYQEDNWRKGIPPKDYLDSMNRHYLKWLRGDTDEPHDRAFIWNVMCCIWEIECGAKYRAEKEKPNA